jgi:hypothetical protein
MPWKGSRTCSSLVQVSALAKKPNKGRSKKRSHKTRSGKAAEAKSALSGARKPKRALAEDEDEVDAIASGSDTLVLSLDDDTLSVALQVPTPPPPVCVAGLEKPSMAVSCGLQSIVAIWHSMRAGRTAPARAGSSAAPDPERAEASREIEAALTVSACLLARRRCN